MAGEALAHYHCRLYGRDVTQHGHILVIILLYCALFRVGPVYGEDLLADVMLSAAAISDIGPQPTGSDFPAVAKSRGVLNAMNILRRVGFISATVSAYTRPSSVYVLPVFLVPSDRGEMAPDPDNPGFNLTGGDFYTGCGNTFPGTGPCDAEKYERARNNLAVHLQMARRKYETMLRNPLNGATRGTFRLASWSHSTKRARAIHQYKQDVTPLIVYSSLSADRLAAQYANEVYHFAGEVLQAANCKQTSCPYVFAITFPGVNIAGGRKLNYGYSNGSGIAFFDFNDVLNSDDDSGSGPHFQSTLLHELGHAFGMPHIFDYCPFHRSAPFPCAQPYDSAWSQSIMGYNEANWIFGCPQKKLPPLDNHCDFPDDITVIDAFPGILMADDLRVLGKNDLAIAGFDYDEVLDGSSDRLSGQGDTDVALPRFTLDSQDTGDPSQLPGALIGGYSEAFPEFFDPVNAFLMWISRQAHAFEWLPFDVKFPEPVSLTRIRFYSGCTLAFPDPVCNQASGVRAGLADGSTSSVITNPPGANVDLLLPPLSGTEYTLAVRTDSAGKVSLRGVRFFGIVDGVERELFPPDEPVASTDFGNAFGGSLTNITGSDQVVSPLSAPFNIATAWHSDPVTQGSFVSLEVHFPHTVTLGFVKSHTGHTNTLHIADQVQIERSCLCDASNATGDAGVCGSASAAQCAAAGNGNRVYEFVKRVNSGPDELVGFPSTTSPQWKIALRTQNLGSDAWMVVRGLRFFNDQGLEIFPAKQTPN